MIERLRCVLIDADWGADGIWLVLSAEEMSAPAPPGYWSGTPPIAEQTKLRNPWGLSEELRHDLKQWNDEMMGDWWGPAGGSPAAGAAPLADRSRDLAERVQDELGENVEVFYAHHGWIHRVAPPGEWAFETWQQEVLGYPPRQGRPTP